MAGIDVKLKAQSVLREIGQEIKQKLPAAIAEARQQIVENLPLYQDGHGARTLATQQATDINAEATAKKEAEMSDYMAKYYAAKESHTPRPDPPAAAEKESGPKMTQ